MGTSSMYGGPTGNSQNNPLLPDDFNENTNNDTNANNDANINNDENENKEIKKIPPPSWQSAKTLMSKFASGSHKSPRTAVSKYVKAYGGAKSASKSAKSGIITTINIGKFSNTVSNNNFKETLEIYNIDYTDKSIKEVLNELINIIAPLPITKEDSVARKALIVAMGELYEEFESNNIDIDNLSNDMFNLIVPTYIECYIYERIINDLGFGIEINGKSSNEIIRKEEDLKDYINSKVKISFRGKKFSKIDFNNPTIKVEIESIFNQCYTVMEEIL